MYIKLRKNGSVTLPALLRRRLSLEPGTYFQVSLDPETGITLTPKCSVCSLCGHQVAAIDTVTGTCADCKDLIEEMVREGCELDVTLNLLRVQLKKGRI